MTVWLHFFFFCYVHFRLFISKDIAIEMENHFAAKFFGESPSEAGEFETHTNCAKSMIENYTSPDNHNSFLAIS